MNTASAIIILAAGSSSRLGLPKQLLQLRGKSLLRHAAETALAARPSEVLAVLGFESDRMKHELDDLPVQIVFNHRWIEGIASSIREGLSRLPADIETALIFLCDQPFVTSDHLSHLMEACTNQKPIIATGYESTAGVPACYHRQVFPELLTLTGDHGAKRIIDLDPERVTAIPFDAATLDIDTMDDYRKFVKSVR